MGNGATIATGHWPRQCHSTAAVRGRQVRTSQSIMPKDCARALRLVMCMLVGVLYWADNRWQIYMLASNGGYRLWDDTYKGVDGTQWGRTTGVMETETSAQRTTWRQTDRISCVAHTGCLLTRIGG
jgi:hypothetical protein